MWVVVDVEADGQIPGDYSMVSFGAVIINKNRTIGKSFYGKLKPISDKWIPSALKISGFSREETLNFPEAKNTMIKFQTWLKENETNRSPMFCSDNNGFDWQFINWYFWHFLGENPFGFSSTNLGSFYKGCIKNMYKNFKHLRKTKHTHNPVNDATGNAEAFLTIINQFNVKSGF